MRLTDKVAVVTGSSRGLGRAIAVCLARYGAHVVVNYRGNQGAAAETAEQVVAAGRRSLAVRADLTQPAAANELAAAALTEFGRVDILVNNVGDFFFKPLGSTEPEEWRYVIDSNLSSVYYMCRAVLPAMRTQRRGCIVNIGLSPTHMVRGAPNISAYAIAKTGVLILTRSLAVEEAPYGIRVNCVSPGLIDNGYLPPEQKEWMQRRVPMKRLGTPEEVAEAAAFLASDKAAYISGANLAVGGAWDWEDRPTDHDGIVHDLFVGEEGRDPARPE